MVCALAWNETGPTTCVDGQTPNSIALFWTMWAVTHLTLGRILAAGIPNRYADGIIDRVSYYPTRIPAATLRTMTAP